MVNMQNMVNIHDHTWLFHRYVCTIKAHTDDSTGLSKGKQRTKQSVFVLRIAVGRIVIGVDGVSATSSTPAPRKLKSVLVYRSTFLPESRDNNGDNDGAGSSSLTSTAFDGVRPPPLKILKIYTKYVKYTENIKYIHTYIYVNDIYMSMTYICPICQYVIYAKYV